MSLSYLNYKTWSEVTRDERFFCSHLFYLIEENGISDFLNYLNLKYDCTFDTSCYWEIAYEACFYRDLWQLRKRKTKLYSPKRTFDLCLLSENSIIIIEAKSKQNFEIDQVESFKRDKEQVKIETGVEKVYLSGLKSSKCPVPPEIEIAFNGPVFTWDELSTYYNNDKILQRADDIYDPNKEMSYGKNNLSGYMTGFDLLEENKKGSKFYVGRFGGLKGRMLKSDIASGEWQTTKYETNKICKKAPNSNWFLLSDFVSLIKSTSPPNNAN